MTGRDAWILLVGAQLIQDRRGHSPYRAIGPTVPTESEGAIDNPER
jgi:hypothetical protein